jgi:hypothetical protein
MPRFANQRIAKLVDYLKTPHSERRMVNQDDPYYWGQSGRAWRQEQDNLHREIQTGYLSPNHAKAILQTKFGLSSKEAGMYVKWSLDPDTKWSRHVGFGVPQAETSEHIMNEILNSSGIKTKLNNQDDPTATDLVRMVDNVKQYIDVQNRNTLPNIITGEEMGTLMPILNTPAGLASEIYDKASPNDTFGVIKQEIQRRSPYARPGKMFESREVVGQKFGRPRMRNGVDQRKPFKESHVKDVIIGGYNDPREFEAYSLRKGHGPYDPMIPSRVIAQDQEKLRNNLMGMTKAEYEKLGGAVLNDDYRKSMDLYLPVNMIEEMSKPDTEYIAKEVLEALDWAKRNS